MDDLSNDLFQSEVGAIDHSPILDATNPLRCDRWLALSAMQKSIRRGDGLTAQRALATLYRDDPSSTWRRLLIIACEDVGIGALGAVVMTTARCANAKALREMGKDEAAVLATARMLAEAPKDRSADLLFAVVLHDPALETMRALMRTYAELGVPERLLEAVAVAIKKAREPFPLLLPLLWLAAAGSESELLDSPLAPSGLINGVPLYALDRHTRFGRRAIKRFAQENAEIAQFLTKRGCDSGDDGALRMAVFYADGALTRPTLRWRHSAELTAAGVAADFHKVHVAADVGAELVELVAAHIADLDSIRIQLLSCALPPER